MEVILLERIERLGQMGDVVKVKPGFARNFLLPERKALRATPENRAYFESQRTQLEAANLQRRQEAEAVAKKLDGQSVALIRQAAESGQLYGSVTTRDITAALDDAGFKVESRQVHLDRPIKELGLTKVRVSLHPEVDATITVNVAKSDEEAAQQMEEATPPPAEFLDEAPAAEAEPAQPAEEGDTELSAKERRRAQRRAREGAEPEAGGEGEAEKGE